ncbi:sensor histidine kinase [Blastococcus sp. TML/M2B]|uniref:sensor histidine kinase n=1 Tax=unclassified Blastococcus TaxID=2619396 RepID=UPI00190B22F8|nr:MULTISPECIES: sensor histidine kinase [unclassified Blastococcus]MBN1094403.1 sensor histidine kinase [Blastococcus sp. TML/M2B]MBN1095363.1 sensor histidine kinase [Blastococcus sp. TML/C7B]
MDSTAGEVTRHPVVPGPRTPPSTTVTHAAAVVGSDADLLAVAVPYLENGLRAGDLVVLSCRPEMAEVVAGALDERLRDVENDPRLTLLGNRAPDAFSTGISYLERASASRSGRLRVLSGIDFGDDPAGWREGQRFESVANRVLGSDAPLASLCLYDRRYLPAAVVESAAATHPLLVDGAAWVANPRFQDPAEYVPALPLPREPVEDVPPVLVIEDAPTLAGLRHDIGAVLARVVRDRDQREDALLAAAEIAANAFRHGRPPVSARVWADDRDLVVTITDHGSGFADLLAGFRPAHGPDLGRGGMGLWLARKLFDHVDLLPGPTGLTVRLASRLR